MRERLAVALAAPLGAAGAVASPLLLTRPADVAGAWAVAVSALAYLAIGALILWQHPRHRLGRALLAASVVWGVGEGVLAFGVRGLQHHPTTGAGLAAVVGGSLRALGWLTLVLVVPLLFPDGHRAGSSRVRRWAWRLAPATIAVFTVASVLSTAYNDYRIPRRLHPPTGLPPAWAGVGDLASLLGFLGAVVTVVLAVTTLVQRWRHDDAVVRQQLLWFALAFACPVVLFPLSVADLGAPWMFASASIPVPLAIAVAVGQRRLYDLTLAVNRSLTYLTLSAMIAGLYAVTVGGVGAMLRVQGAPWLPWVAAGVVAVSFAPLRNALQQGANKLTYGQWAQPAEVLASTGRRLADATDTVALLGVIASEIADGLGLAYVVIRDSGGRALAAHGVAGEETEALPLTAYGVQVGDLRWSGRRLRDTERALLVDLAHQLGGVVHAAALVAQVRDAQERLVLAREEERKRLRRDLHDGLGPALAGLSFGVDTLRNRLAARDQAAPVDPDAELTRLRDGIAACVVDVRRIVEGLRPPDLDELGLAGALDQLVSRFGAEAGVTVDVAVAPLPPVPAAVEVAAYRVAQEALTNVVRHARAGHARVQVAVDGDRLVLEVHDDGRGAAMPRPGGVGLGSMHERAAELGGTVTVASSEGAGTLVRALLPLAGAGAS